MSKKFTYNRLLILGSCESGRTLFEKLIRKSKYIIFNSEIERLIYNRKTLTTEIFEFITQHVPENRILCTLTTDPLLFNNLKTYNFNSWKFIYTYRDYYNAFASYRAKTEKDFEYVIDYTYRVTINTLMFYQKIENQCLRIDINDLLNNINQKIEKVFNFLELPLPDQQTINECLEFDPAFNQFKEGKIDINHSFDEYIVTLEKERLKTFLRNKGFIDERIK